MPFGKEELRLRYDWKPAAEHANVSIIGFPENRILNIYDGYEVLPFLNRYMEIRGMRQLPVFHKLERTLRTTPFIRGTHYDIKCWLDERFEN